MLAPMASVTSGFLLLYTTTRMAAFKPPGRGMDRADCGSAILARARLALASSRSCSVMSFLTACVRSYLPLSMSSVRFESVLTSVPLILLGTVLETRRLTRHP